MRAPRLFALAALGFATLLGCGGSEETEGPLAETEQALACAEDYRLGLTITRLERSGAAGVRVTGTAYSKKVSGVGNFKGFKMYWGGYPFGPAVPLVAPERIASNGTPSGSPTGVSVDVPGELFSNTLSAWLGDDPLADCNYDDNFKVYNFTPNWGLGFLNKRVETVGGSRRLTLRVKNLGWAASNNECTLHVDGRGGIPDWRGRIPALPRDAIFQKVIDYLPSGDDSYTAEVTCADECSEEFCAKVEPAGRRQASGLIP